MKEFKDKLYSEMDLLVRDSNKKRSDSLPRKLIPNVSQEWILMLREKVKESTTMSMDDG